MRTTIIKLIIGVFLINCLGPLPVQADEFVLPKPGAMVHLSLEFNPPILKGIKVYPDNPFRFDFVLDQGDSTPAEALAKAGSSSSLNQEQLKTESTRLIKYFLASLTIPEKDLWVNLSPYEKDRIVPESFGQTEMGRDLLAQDYMLKQITASLIYPEDKVGKKFWKRIYEEAQKKYGTTQVPVNTFNKVWIVPEKAVVYENAKAGTAYVVESRLKVMLEQDYLALEKNTVIPAQAGIQNKNDISTIGSQIVREIVIPELTKEVNVGKNFSQLRQVYNSLILATWYKKKIKDSILSQVYADKNKVQGVNIDDPKEKEKIYQQYLQAFKKGVYNYIKEEIITDTESKKQGIFPKKYFSGGAWLSQLDQRMKTQPYPKGFGKGKDFAQLTEIAVGLKSVQKVNTAMTTEAFNTDIDRIASEKGITLGPNTKVALFIGGHHIQNGYYYDLFNAILRNQFGFDIVYLPYPIAEKDTEKVNLVKEQLNTNSRIVGAVITRPWKEAFYENGDNRIGAVNFIVKDAENQNLVRHAVDGEAWLKGLNYDLGHDFQFSGMKVVIIGSGGAAREIAETLNHKGVESVSFIDVSQERLSGLATMIESLKTDYRPVFIRNQGAQIDELLDQAIYQAHLIINATGIGRKETLGQSPLQNHKVFHPGQVIVDLISDTETQILTEAKNRGVTKAYYGRTMFIYGMVIFMKGWMDKFKTTVEMPSEEQLFQSISLWLDNYSLLGNNVLAGVNAVLQRPPSFAEIPRDAAMFSLENNTKMNKGGIDLTSNKFLQTQNQGEAIKFHIDPVMFAQLQNALGFTPVILNIQPMTNLKLFLGLTDPQPVAMAS